jgi:hypothetical protein
MSLFWNRKEAEYKAAAQIIAAVTAVKIAQINSEKHETMDDVKEFIKMLMKDQSKLEARMAAVEKHLNFEKAQK